jgi:hypothetical protein
MADFQREQKNRPSGDSVENEVQRLLKEFHGKLPYSEVQKLKQKYSNDKIVDAIQEAFANKLKHVQKSAEQFARRVSEKYGTDYPMHKLLEKARRYKQKKNLSDGEFEEFRRAYERILANAPSYSKSEYSRPSTNLGRTLGTINVDPVEGLKIGDDEYNVLQDILKMHATNKLTHNQVVIQALTLKSDELLSEFANLARNTGSGSLYDATKHNYMNAIHPIVFAMFGTKIPLFENRMLLANLPNIVRARYNKESVQTKPDYELLYDLITDPNDVVCDKTSPMRDLRNRCVLQDALQRCVLNMRMKRFFEPCSAELAVAIESCKLLNIENPELLYSGDESVYFRRIISTFSLRPTVVRTDNSIDLNANAFQHIASVPLVSSLNILTLRLPPKGPTTPSVVGSVDLSHALKQEQFFIENGKFVTKSQQIIYSRNVLLFNVLRKYNRIFMNKLFAPFNFSTLPVSVSALERINDTPVEHDYHMKVGNDTFRLAATISSHMTNLNPSKPEETVVTGCKAYVYNYGDDYTVATFNPTDIYCYNPYVAINGKPIVQSVGATYLTASVSENGKEDVKNRSTIFIYATPVDNTTVADINY